MRNEASSKSLCETALLTELHACGPAMQTVCEAMRSKAERKEPVSKAGPSECLRFSTLEEGLGPAWHRLIRLPRATSLQGPRRAKTLQAGAGSFRDDFWSKMLARA